MTVDVTTITVAQFEAQFSRNFPFLDAITYDPTKTYFSGQKVYYPTNGGFYVAQQQVVPGTLPTTGTPNWCNASDDTDNYVSPTDISNAFVEAQAVFNQALYSTDPIITLAYLYLTAHYLAYDLRAAAAGIMAGASFPVQSKGAGSVNEAYAIPEAYTESPILAQYTSTAYGMKYLSMTLPSLVGNVMSVYGGTNP